MFYAIHLPWDKVKKIILCVGFCVIVLCGIAFHVVYPIQYVEIIEKYARQYDLDPALVCAVIQVESRFVKTAKSHKNASGLMQITKPTGDWLAEKMKLDGYDYDNIFVPDLNISIGCYYLNMLIQKYDFNYRTALAAYNAGTGNVSKWLSDPEYSGDGENLDTIPFEETRNYVQRVLFTKEIYRILLKIYGGHYE